jgi:hypothetical protein
MTQFEVHVSVHRDIIMNSTNKMQLCRLLYYSLSALHVSGDVFAHHQEHLTVFTVSGNIHQCRCRLVSWMSWNLELYLWINNIRNQVILLFLYAFF